MTIYKFIDGAYFEKSLEEFGREWFAGVTPPFDPGAVQNGALKVFYYDALPIQRKHESDADFEVRRLSKMGFFARLKTFRGWHVIHGIAKRNRGLEAQQKEVDVLLAVDMLTHAHRRNMTHVEFLAGDLDFRPLTDAVVREGIFVTLEYDPKHAAADLVDTCDARRPWDYWSMVQLLTADFRTTHIPASRFASDPNAIRQNSNILERGMRGSTCVAELMYSLTNKQLFIVATEHSASAATTGANRLHVHHPSDRELLKRLWGKDVEVTEWASN